MVYCVAFGCNASSAKGGGIHHFFKFPTDAFLLKKWLAKIKRTNFKLTKHSRLCSAHFERCCFARDPDIMAALGYPGARISLRSGAVPTIFSTVDAALKPSIHKRQVSIKAGLTAALPKLKASRTGNRSAIASVANDGSVCALITPSAKSSSLKYQIPYVSAELTKSAYRKCQQI